MSCEQKLFILFQSASYIYITLQCEEPRSYPISEVISEYEIPGKRIGKCLIEIQHLQQTVPFDGVQITVGQSPDVGRRLSQRRVLPK